MKDFTFATFEARAPLPSKLSQVLEALEPLEP